MKTNLLLTIFIASISMTCNSNTTIETKDEKQLSDALMASNSEVIYEKVDQFPEFPGGMEGLTSFMQSNLKYPEDAKANNIEGKVLVEFVIRKTGKVDAVLLKKGIGNGCDEAAIELIKSMPNWSPGVKNNQRVHVKLVLPIAFKLS